jgi:SAM-dependent methyltransferase
LHYELAPMLHEGRSQLLRQLPKRAPVFCSVGCAGTWYFQWIEENCGPIGHHIGLELFAPKPPDLPPNVEWVANSASDMSDVAGDSVDVLFSGQNIEHLFAEQVKGFFHEANRVLRTGGTLCIDSPNRSLTVPLAFSYHEHVLEFSVGEAVTLTRLAGFEVQSVQGVWRCEDTRWGLLSLGPEGNAPQEVERRLAQAGANPRDSVIWWVVARKTGPVAPEFGAEVDRIFKREFPSFARGRLVPGVGTLRAAAGTEVIVEVRPSDRGHVFHGPYIALPAGDYRAEFLVRPLAPGGYVVAEVTSDFGRTSHGRMVLHAEAASEGWQSMAMRLQLPGYTTAVETTCVAADAHALIRFGAQLMPMG